MLEQLAEKMIRKRVSEGDFDFTNHAIERMSEREIDIDKVLECIIKGKTIEFQTDKRTNDIKVLFQEATDKSPEVYTVVAALETPLIITVCKTKDEAWECIDNVLKRRGKY
ncbi:MULTISPECIES: DUF4258 domain-containing protein [unclassified Clostridium]|uniref:DUF4258 domain-containing protein n=1 Tax=unclassified Clostridium TaxID=2614128 RepID=UPI000298172A|nr:MULTISPECIES: DUF4258 domain-containing protein [unclassified Clostridium]EKQ55446.1 MAG: hypothetical protein A370_02662 [Clostridium sp. Maddingley MBC34-26]